MTYFPPSKEGLCTDPFSGVQSTTFALYMSGRIGRTRASGKKEEGRAGPRSLSVSLVLSSSSSFLPCLLTPTTTREKVPVPPSTKPLPHSAPRAHQEDMETIRLPNTSPENRLSYTHVKLLTAVHPQAWNAAGFEGTLHAAGGAEPGGGTAARRHRAGIRRTPGRLEAAPAGEPMDSVAIRSGGPGLARDRHRI